MIPTGKLRHISVLPSVPSLLSNVGLRELLAHDEDWFRAHLVEFYWSSCFFFPDLPHSSHEIQPLEILKGSLQESGRPNHQSSSLMSTRFAIIFEVLVQMHAPILLWSVVIPHFLTEIVNQPTHTQFSCPWSQSSLRRCLRILTVKSRCKPAIHPGKSLCYL